MSQQKDATQLGAEIDLLRHQLTALTSPLREIQVLAGRAEDAIEVCTTLDRAIQRLANEVARLDDGKEQR